MQYGSTFKFSNLLHKILYNSLIDILSSSGPILTVSDFILLSVTFLSFLIGQEQPEKSRSFSPLTKKVFSYSKLDFVTSDG